MNTVQNIMSQLKLGQDMAYNLGQPQARAQGLAQPVPPQGVAQPAPTQGVAPEGPVSLAAAVPIQAQADTQAIAFNPAQIQSSDLESAHNSLDPDRVARLLGLLE